MFKDRQKGFTLVEMAIVLVIIGIILAGVMKGRDIVRGSQVKQFSQQFAQKWGTIAQTYYDKTGQQLNDGTDNGGAATTPDGVMDGQLNAQDVLDVCESVGITPCTMVKSKLTDWTAGSCSGATNISATLVEGEYTGTEKVYVDLIGLDINANSRQYRRNAVVLYCVPTDVAKGLDTAIDGQEDGNSGSLMTLANVLTVAAEPYLIAAPANNNPTDVTSTNFADASDGTYERVVIVMDY